MTHVFLDMAGRERIQIRIYFKKSCIVAEIDPDVPVLFVCPFGKQGAEAGHTHQPRFARPTWIEIGSRFQFPQIPADLKFVGVVVVQQLQGCLYGLLRFRATLAPSIDMLQDRGLAPAHRPYGCGVDARVAAMRSEGAQDCRQFVGECGQAQVRKPQTQIKRVGHLY